MFCPIMRKQNKIVPKMKQFMEKYPILKAAQKMTYTENGLLIATSSAPLMTNSGIDRFRRNTKIDQVKRLVLTPPFSNMDRVTEHLYLTGIGGLTKENFKNYQITCVINATHELPILKKNNIDSYRIPVDDDIVEDIAMFFEEIADLIENNAINGGNTVVHCMAGVSRSTTLVLAYLIKYKSMTLKEAFHMVRTIRPCVRPNIAFMGQLIVYEEKRNKSTSVAIVRTVQNNRLVRIPNFYESECVDLYRAEIIKQTGISVDPQQ